MMDEYERTYEQRSNNLKVIRGVVNIDMQRQLLESFIDREKTLIAAIPAAAGPLLDASRSLLRALNAPAPAALVLPLPVFHPMHFKHG